MHTLKLSEQALLTIHNALQEIPHKYAAPVLHEIGVQMQASLVEQGTQPTTTDANA